MVTGTANELPEQVMDSRGNLHQLQSHPLGQGGQGVVFRTRDQHTAVKLITDNIGQAVMDSGARQDLQRKLEDVQMLPLGDLHVAKPTATLDEPYVGYVMQLLTGMTPMKKLIAVTAPNLAEFYLSGGGLRRRLRLLARTAGILARLHAVPLVYGDISDNNVFVSEDPDAMEVWLIDADNLHYVSQPGPTVYTPSFGAPEIVGGRSPNTLSDVFSFAVLAYGCLSQQHPFLGALVEEGDWAAVDDQDLESRAFRGEFPWIGDAEDDSNACDHGIPRSITLTPDLQALFQATFGQGRTVPTARPRMAKWVESLMRTTGPYGAVAANRPFTQIPASALGVTPPGRHSCTSKRGDGIRKWIWTLLT